MDTHRFDDMVRTLGERGTRRDALRLLAGGVLGVLAGAPMPGMQARAKSKKKGNCPKKPCPRGQKRNKRTCKCECVRQRCSGGKEWDAKSCSCRCPRDLRECRDKCVGRDRCCPSDPPCPEDPKGCCHAPGLDVCTIDGCCREIDGMKACNGFCVNTKNDPHHCGGCNKRCDPGEPCRNGTCGSNAECGNGKTPCGDTCCVPGEACCHGECLFAGSAPCTKDGWCPTTEGHACCGTEDCAADGPCCRFSAGETCCVSSTASGAFETTCCPGPELCAPGGCCPAGTTWTSDLGCDACCPDNNINCDGCVAPVAGRG